MMDMVAVMVVKGWRNGMIIILMCFEGRATGFMKGLNGNFVSLFLYFLWPKTLERWVGHWGKTQG